MDYTALSAILEFGECATRSCGEVVIIGMTWHWKWKNHWMLFSTETVDLDDRITLSPTVIEIVIVDNNGAYDDHLHSLHIFPQWLLWAWIGYCTMSLSVLVQWRYVLWSSIQISTAPLDSLSSSSLRQVLTLQV